MVNAKALVEIVPRSAATLGGPYKSKWTSLNIAKTWQGLSQHVAKHGWLDAVNHVRMTNEVNFGFGKLKGQDRFGNKYYEDVEYHHFRRRRVVFGNKKSWSAGDTPAEWNGWLTYKTDATPMESPPPALKFKLAHQPVCMSVMGSDANYVPPGHYNNTLQNPTTISKPRYESWKPGM